MLIAALINRNGGIHLTAELRKDTPMQLHGANDGEERAGEERGRIELNGQHHRGRRRVPRSSRIGTAILLTGQKYI